MAAREITTRDINGGRRTGVVYVKRQATFEMMKSGVRDALLSSMRADLGRRIADSADDGRAYVTQWFPIEESQGEEEFRRDIKTYTLYAIVALYDYREAEVGETCVIPEESAAAGRSTLQTPQGQDFRRTMYGSGAARLTVWERVA